MVYKGCRYTTCFYNRCKKTNDSIVQLLHNSIGIITSIYLIRRGTEYNVFIFYKSLQLTAKLLVKTTVLKKILIISKISD